MGFGAVAFLPREGVIRLGEDNCSIVLTEEGLCRPKSHQQHASLTTKNAKRILQRSDAHPHRTCFFYRGFPLLTFSQRAKKLSFFFPFLRSGVFGAVCIIRNVKHSPPVSGVLWCCCSCGILALSRGLGSPFSVAASTLSCIQGLGNTHRS